MVITTILFFIVARRLWKWPLAAAGGLCAAFLVVDTAFFGANILKIPHGGWFPLVVAAGIFTMMTTWRRGRALLGAKLRGLMIPLDRFLAQVETHPPQRVPGTAVFMSGNPNATPSALLHNLKHNKILHERIVILSVITEDVPRVPASRRVEVTTLPGGFYRLLVHYGFMDDPDVPSAIRMGAALGLDVEPAAITYFLGRENLRPTRRRSGMMLWRETLFAWMSRHALDATRYYRLPPNQVVELGTQIEM
jgi:KUP system potassium uptake protein